MSALPLRGSVVGSNVSGRSKTSQSDVVALQPLELSGAVGQGVRHAGNEASPPRRAPSRRIGEEIHAHGQIEAERWLKGCRRSRSG